jgi:cell division protein FtsL
MNQTHELADRHWQNRAVMREIDERRVRRLARVVLCIVVAAAPTAVYLLQHNESVKIAYEVNGLRAERELLLKEERRLSLEKARLESLASVEKWAKRENRMIQPGEGTVVVVAAPDPDAGVLLASGAEEETPKQPR